MLFLFSPGGMGIAPIIKLSVVSRMYIRLLVLPRFHGFGSNESQPTSRIASCVIRDDSLEYVRRREGLAPGGSANQADASRAQGSSATGEVSAPFQLATPAIATLPRSASAYAVKLNAYLGGGPPRAQPMGPPAHKNDPPFFFPLRPPFNPGVPKTCPVDPRVH